MTDERRVELATEFNLGWSHFISAGSTAPSPTEFAILDGISNLLSGHKLLAGQLAEIKRQIDHVAEPQPKIP